MSALREVIRICYMAHGVNTRGRIGELEQRLDLAERHRDLAMERADAANGRHYDALQEIGILKGERDHYEEQLAIALEKLRNLAALNEAKK